MCARGCFIFPTGARRLDTDRWRSSPGPTRVQTLTVDETVAALYGTLAETFHHLTVKPNFAHSRFC